MSGYASQIDATLAALDEARMDGGVVVVHRETTSAEGHDYDSDACWCVPIQLNPEETLTREQVADALRGARCHA